MALRVRVGKLIIECDDIADLDAVVQRYGGEVPPLTASTSSAAPSVESAPTPTAKTQGKGKYASKFATTPEKDAQLVKALVEAGHHGIPAHRLNELLGGPRGRAVSGAIRGFAFRVGINPADIVEGPRIANTRGWRLTQAAISTLTGESPRPLEQGRVLVPQRSIAPTCGEMALEVIAKHSEGMRASEIARAIDHSINTTGKALRELHEQSLIERHHGNNADVWTLPGLTPRERGNAGITIESAITQVLMEANGKPVSGHALRDTVTTIMAAAGRKVSAPSITTGIYKLLAKNRISRSGADEHGPRYALHVESEEESERLLN